MLSSNKNTYEDLNDPNKKKKVWTFEQTDYFIKNIDDLYENTEVISPDEEKAKEIISDCINNVNDIFSQKIKPFKIDTTIKLPKIAEDSVELFLSNIKRGLKFRKIKLTPEVNDRLKHEIDVIINSGYVDYFNILEDIVRWTKDNFGKYSVGAGRGSAAGSLVNYLLGITNVNPLKYPMMIFERFLDPARPDPPDIDTDIATNVRPHVIEYIKKKYGENRVMSIGTHTKNQLKSSIADVFRTLNVPFGEVIAVTKKIEDDEDMSVDEFMKINSDLKALIDKYPESYDLIEGIRGQLRNMGQHPGGVCISGVDIKENLPVYRTNKSTFATANTEGVDVRELSELGYIKYDLLGLGTLQYINETSDLIKKRYGVDIGDQSFSPIYLDISNKDFVSIEFKALVLENEKQKRNSKVFVSNLLIVGTSTIVQTTIEIPYYMLESKIEFETYPREGP
jgi:DNA polymerase III alpha subunit